MEEKIYEVLKNFSWFNQHSLDHQGDLCVKLAELLKESDCHDVEVIVQAGQLYSSLKEMKEDI